jgi:hypothetical protein
MSGVILGPPNHHDYQNQLRKLHAERYSRLPFEVYKARVKIVRDEEVVKKWVDDQSWKTEYICLNMPEPLRLADMAAVEKHFRESHKDNIIKQVGTHNALGTAARGFRSPELSRLVRSSWEDQRRFPLQIATVLSQQFAGHGLQFFKVNRTITHVSVARPHYLDLALIPVSDGVKRIVDFINATPKSTRRQLLQALAPTPPAPAAPIPVEPAPASAEATPAAVAEPPGPTAEQTAVIADLHWLIHEGHVIEFANGLLECAKKPLPKPPKPEPKANAGLGQPAGSPATVAESPAAAESSPPTAPIESTQPENLAPVQEGQPTQEAALSETSNSTPAQDIPSVAENGSEALAAPIHAASTEPATPPTDQTLAEAPIATIGSPS